MQIRQRKHAGFPIALLLICLGALWLFSCRTEAATVPVTAKIPVTCSGGNPSENFVFVMEMETKEMQTPDQLVIRMKAGEEGAFTIHYVYPGTYHYRIRQEAGSDSKTTYDQTVYEIDMFVTEDETGVLYAEPVVYTEGSSEKKAEASFTNSVESTPSKSSRSSAVKTGDTGNLRLYAGLLLLSSAAMVLLGKGLIQKKGGKQ